jgi:hypothetical protein
LVQISSSAPCSQTFPVYVPSCLTEYQTKARNGQRILQTVAEYCILKLKKSLFLLSERVRVNLRLTVSQYVLASSPLFGRLTRYCFLFKSFSLEFVVLPLWGALSDDRPGLSFESHSLVICLCVHLLFTFSFHPFTIMYTIQYIYIYIYIYIYKASFSPGSVQQIMPYYSLVAHATTAV